MKKIILAVLWIVSIVAACIVTGVIQKRGMMAAIADAKSRAAQSSFGDADMAILFACHGNGEEQKVLFEALRDSAELKKAKDLIDQQKRDLKIANEKLETSENLKAQYDNSLALYKKANEAATELINAYKARDEAKANTPVQTPANYSSAVPQGPPSYIPPITKAVEVETPAPNWQMPNRNQAMAVARKVATEKWKDNYSMLEYEIERQMEGYDKLAQYYKQNWKPLMRNLLNSSAQKWPDNYSMMVYEIERQIDAKERLDGRR